MHYDSFWKLHEKLRAGIEHAGNKLQAVKKSREETPTKKGFVKCPPVPNGPITTSVRLACALRYFAGGSSYDLMGKYGVSHTEVLKSVWCVVEAVNNVEEFFILYPADHQEQRKIAADFKTASGVGFDNCGGAIDGILPFVLIFVH
jgi:hypothetical protein